MNTADFTQLASDGKQASANEGEESNHYNDRYERISVDCLADNTPATHCLNHVHRALQGIAVVNTILANDRLSWDMGHEPLNDYMTGGLHSAVQALAEMAIDKIELYADGFDRRIRENEALDDIVASPHRSPQ